jgi:hypothetical protein
MPTLWEKSGNAPLLGEKGAINAFRLSYKVSGREYPGS